MPVSLKKKVRKLGAKLGKPADFDPEDEEQQDNDSSVSDSGLDEPMIAGREHYETVSKSKLRKPEQVELDTARYGSRPVNRSALEDDDDKNDPLAPDEESDEDPFASGHNDRDDSFSDIDMDSASQPVDDEDEDDEEIDSDDAFEAGEEAALRAKGFKFRGSGRSITELPQSDDSEDDDSEDTTDSGGDDDDDDDDNDDNDNEHSHLHEGSSELASETDSGDDVDMEKIDNEDDEDSDDHGEEDQDEMSGGAARHSYSAVDRDRLKSLISSDTAQISASLLQAAADDAKKGNAVKQQYQSFDRFLDARIKLQKGLNTSNELGSTSKLDDEGQIAIKKAEEAVLNLYNTIELIRYSIMNATATTTTSTSKKRKRSTPITVSTPVEEISSRLANLEADATIHRRAVLDKWASKTRGPNVSYTSKSKLQADQTSSKLTTVLDAYLLSSAPKLIEDSKTLQPTSTSTNGTRSTSNTTDSLPPYQDTLFYQALLRDLIATKSYINPTTSADLTFNINDKIALPAKIHRQVDRKASKGRKIRYTVHEKLENFMAARGTGELWTESATREFFGSLMGMRNQLVEDNDGEADDDDFDLQNGEVEALRLFRS